MSGALSPPPSGVTVYQALPYTRALLLEDIQLSSVLMLCLALCPLGEKQTQADKKTLQSRGGKTEGRGPPVAPRTNSSGPQSPHKNAFYIDGNG